MKQVYIISAFGADFMGEVEEKEDKYIMTEAFRLHVVMGVNRMNNPSNGPVYSVGRVFEPLGGAVIEFPKNMVVLIKPEQGMVDLYWTHRSRVKGLSLSKNIPDNIKKPGA